MPIQVTHFCQQRGRWWLWTLALILPLALDKALSCWQWSISEEASQNHQGASAWGFQQRKIVNCWPWLQISSVPLSASLCLDTEQTCEHKQGDWPYPALHRNRPQTEMAQTRSKGDGYPLTTEECRAARGENRSLLRPRRPMSPQLSACCSLSHEGDRAGCGPQTPKGFFMYIKK